VACNNYFRNKTNFAQMRDASRGRGYHALYQGPTLEAAEKLMFCIRARL